MSRGKFDIIGNGIIAVDHELSSNFTLSGGTINIKSTTGHTGLSTKGNLTIKGGSMNVNILEIVNNTTMIVEGGILETGGIKIEDNGKLINKGMLIVHGILREMERLKIPVQSVEMELCRKETEQILVVSDLSSLRMFRIRMNW